MEHSQNMQNHHDTNTRDYTTMTPQDIFIQYLLSQQLVSPDHVQKASMLQQQQGGDLLNILFEILARHRHQDAFRREISQDGLPSLPTQTYASGVMPEMGHTKEPAWTAPAKMLSAFQTVVGVELPEEGHAKELVCTAPSKMLNAFQTVVGVELPEEALAGLIRAYDSQYAPTERNESQTPIPQKPVSSAVFQAVDNRYHSNPWESSDAMYTPLLQGNLQDNRRSEESGPIPYRIKSCEDLDQVSHPSRQDLQRADISAKSARTSKSSANLRAAGHDRATPSSSRILPILKSQQKNMTGRHSSSRSLQDMMEYPLPSESSRSWKWMLFVVMGILLLSLAIGGAFRYHAWIAKLLS